MNSSLDLKSLTERVSPAISFVRRYIRFLFFVSLAILYGFLIFQIRSFSQVEPTEDAVSDKLKSVQRPHIDQSAISNIQQLRDQNVEVQSLFQDARDNPFSE